MDSAKDSDVENMRKFNWDEFKNKYNKIAVNCKTEEEAKDFCKRMHEHGMKWCTGKSYMEKTNYEEYKGETCYAGSGKFSSYRYYNSEGYEILEWGDYMQKEFTKADLEDGMVVEYRCVALGRRLVVKDMLIGIDGSSNLKNYNDDLTEIDGDPELSIIRVYKIKYTKRFENILDDNNLELIWERTQKKMTVEEMRKKLEELTGEQIEVTA